MDLNNLANIGELVAATATVVTLVFVGYELRANRKQSRLEMLTALDKGWNEINAQVVADEHLAHLLFKGLYDPDSLTEEEAPRFWLLFGQYINQHKSVWALLAKDGLNTHHEQWLRADISTVYNTKGAWKVFQSLKHWNPPEFTEFVTRQRETKLELVDWRQLEA